MLDLFHLPTDSKANVQIFNCPSSVTNAEWQQWVRPHGVSMLQLICIGGGSGGGGGTTGATTTARGGGGGGGSSGITRVTVPAIFLPSTLFIQVGIGGAGAAPGGGTAGSGVLSYVTIFQDISANNVLALSGAAGPVGGVSGTSGAAGTGGAAGTIAVIGSMCLAGFGHFNVIAGQAGASGGSPAGSGGAAITFPQTGCVSTGGAGGGGVTTGDQVGGGYNSIAGALVSDYRPTLPPAGSKDGSSLGLQKPLWNYAGCGGAASDAGIGGNGGPGTYGAAGGGGGGGTTGGTGGNGGAGYIVIFGW